MHQILVCLGNILLFLISSYLSLVIITFICIYFLLFDFFLNRCNEVLFGVTSIDPLFSLSADEVTLNSGHRMIRMAGHILQQQSFYPSFPVPNGISAPVSTFFFLF